MQYKTEVLVIGAGGAGLTAAIHAKENGADVVVLTKEYATRSQTCMAQGGINAALGNNGEDSVEDHISNTLKSAHGMADELAVRHLCQEGVKAIEWLDNIGVCFSRTADAKIAQRSLGGASAPRACYAQDYTGLKILHTLYDRCMALGIEIKNEKFLLDFLVEDESVYGVSVLDMRSGEAQTYEANAVIVATGGYSRVYDKHSTNSSASTGDGIAAALRAGAKLKDMAFIQFHPTGLKSSSILISESARGAGGHLLNSKNERFVDELLPRDEVARAIHTQIQNGEEVFLDIRHLGEEFIDEELPQERKLAKLYEKVDPVNELIPIKPVAHYTMGGIEVDINSSTNIQGLFAAGECANHKVHGANRLGGNSLLELIVFGKEAGKNAAKYAKNFNKTRSVLQIQEPSFHKESSINFYEIKEELGDLFYTKVGIARKEQELLEVQERLQSIKAQLPLMGIVDESKKYNTNKLEFLEFLNMLAVCEQVVSEALEVRVSCGAHYRVD